MAGVRGERHPSPALPFAYGEREGKMQKLRNLTIHAFRPVPLA
jgi:hypothetical protein